MNKFVIRLNQPEHYTLNLVQKQGPIGPQGPSGVSELSSDAGNILTLGSDTKLFAPTPSWGALTNKPNTLGGYDITDAYSISQVDALISGISLTPGPAGANGQEGAYGGNSTLYTFENITTDSNPSVGFARLNNSNLSLVTRAFISKTANSGITVTSWLNSVLTSNSVNRAIVTFGQRNNFAYDYARYYVTGVTDATGYIKYDLTYIDHSGSLNTNGANLLISIALTGDKGNDGVSGPNSVTTSTSTNITGVLGGNGTTVTQVTALGNLSLLGAIGSTSGLPIFTGASGVLNAESNLATARTNLGLGTGNSPTFAGVTIGGRAINVASVYLRLNGSVSTGQDVAIGSRQVLGDTNGGSLTMMANGVFGWSNTNNNAETTMDLRFHRDAANTSHQRNGTNGQIARWAKTFTSATNFRAFEIDCATDPDNIRIGSRVGSLGGTDQGLQFGRYNAAGAWTSWLGIDTSGIASFASRINATEYRVSNDVRMLTAGSGILLFGANTQVRFQNNAADAWSEVSLGDIIMRPSSSRILSVNGQFTIEMTSNTAGNLVYRGSDGTTRRVGLPFSNQRTLIETFEAYAKNIFGYAISSVARTGSRVDSITYTIPSIGTFTKTLGYTGDIITTVTLSGSIPAGIPTVKTITYSGNDITGTSYT